MANNRDTLRQVQDFIEERLERLISCDERYFESGLFDSLFALQLIAFLEQTFEFEVVDDDLEVENFSTLRNVAAFVEGKLR